MTPLKELISTIYEQQQRPVVAMTMSPGTERQIYQLAQAVSAKASAREIAGPEVMGTPIQVLRDAPDGEVLLFYSVGAWRTFARFYSQHGYGAALRRIKAQVEEGLVVEATLRSLTDRS